MILHIIGYFSIEYYFLLHPVNWLDKIIKKLIPWWVLASIGVIFFVSFTDPGIYRLNPDPVFSRLQSTGGRVEYYGEEGQIYIDPVTSQRYIFKCIECGVFKELDEDNKAYGFEVSDTVHCDHCDCCVLGYDHHCGVLGTCIGKKNLTAFYMFPVFAIGFFLLFYMALLSNLTNGFGVNVKS